MIDYAIYVASLKRLLPSPREIDMDFLIAHVDINKTKTLVVVTFPSL